MNRFLLMLLVTLSITACAGSTTGLTIDSPARPLCCADVPVRFEYLGSGGWLIARGDEALLTAPFFTNPSLFRVWPFSFRASADRVRRHFENVEGRERVRIVLAGHSHYDHIGDMPEVFRWLSADAKIYGGTTMASLLGDRAQSVVAGAGSITTPGEWTRIGDIRFMPILSEHAPHFRGIKVHGGHISSPAPALPRRTAGWKEGEPLAFLVDLLDANGDIAFRIYYDDAAHDWPYGYPDPVTRDEHRIDVAILCAASFHETADYPAALLAYLNPTHVLVGHWEDFFTSPDLAERTVRGTDVREFLSQLAPRPYTMLRRHGKVTFKG